MLVLATLISLGYLGFTDWAYVAGTEYGSPNHNTHERRPHHFALTSFLADQQDKRSSSHQQGKQSTDGERESPVPSI